MSGEKKETPVEQGLRWFENLMKDKAAAVVPAPLKGVAEKLAAEVARPSAPKAEGAEPSAEVSAGGSGKGLLGAANDLLSKGEKAVADGKAVVVAAGDKALQAAKDLTAPAVAGAATLAADGKEAVASVVAPVAADVRAAVLSSVANAAMAPVVDPQTTTITTPASVASPAAEQKPAVATPQAVTATPAALVTAHVIAPSAPAAAAPKQPPFKGMHSDSDPGIYERALKKLTENADKGGLKASDFPILSEMVAQNTPAAAKPAAKGQSK